MTTHAHSFVAEKLSEVVKDKQRRQHLMVKSLAIFGLIFLTVFSIQAFWIGSVAIGGTLAFFSVWGAANLYLLSYRREWGLIGLTLIIYSLSLYLVVTGGHDNTGIMWVYPLAAIVIFINRFKVGLLLNLTFVAVLSVLLNQNWLVTDYNALIKLRFVLTLMALGGMCHIAIFFQQKMDDYIMKMHEEGIHKLAYFDSLTQLANRATFRSILYHSTQRMLFEKSALVYIDLDNFKQVNDQYGHDYGDKVLGEFGQKIRQLVPQCLGRELGDYDIARLGGDEFAIFVEDAFDEAEVVQMGHEILNLFTDNRMHSLERVHSKVSASVGVVFVSVAQLDLEESLKLADRAMYEAKKAGKNQVKVVY
ncbi:GGDEF domain-containing protein [Vibrio agarivorans]|uniref:GGDEF domain-containing protein n=1 Tax=Vibrio agarivorans TaxID=153622 RepID=UPI0025B5512C|nr:GGDEF domain-containing protein [Vibrio agarivorans]MDN3663103.1 GGDEF domain-containing protein [Vibrio agarivorans]